MNFLRPEYLTMSGYWAVAGDGGGAAGAGGAGGAGGAAGAGGAGAGAAGGGGAGAAGGGAAGAGGGAAGAAGGQTTDWRTGVSSDYTHIAERFETPNDVLKSFSEMESFRGRSVLVPAADANDEQRKEFFEKTGKVEGASDFLAAHAGTAEVPESADGYTLGEIPEGLVKDEQLEGWFKTAAFGAKLSTKQTAGMYEAWNKMVQESMEAGQANDKQQQQKLRTEWGGDYDANLSAAKSVITKHGSQALVEELNQMNLASHPEFAAFLVTVAKQTGEHSMVGTGADGSPGIRTPEDIELELSEVESELMKLDASNPRYKVLTDKTQRLFKQLNDRKQSAA